MHLGPLCMQLRAPISFFLLFGANSSPEKVQHFLVSPNSIKIVPNGMFFGAATGSGVLLCWGVSPKPSLFEGPTPPLSKLKFPPHRENRRLSTQSPFFSDSPERFALLLGQCAALRSLAQSTTPFLASGKAKNGVFSLRIAHIALFYTINFFF